VKRVESLESLVLRLNGTSQRRVVVVAVGMTTLVVFVAEKPFNVLITVILQKHGFARFLHNAPWTSASFSIVVGVSRVPSMENLFVYLLRGLTPHAITAVDV
jgi:flagellar biogenesis protein FliO